MKMLKISNLMLCVAVLGFNLCGCESKPAPNAVTAPPASQQADNKTRTEADEIKEAMAKLAPEDAKAAEKQQICPVSTAKLGSMGPPEKVDVNGQPVWICCGGCRDLLLENSEKYLAKLKKE